MKKTWHK